MNTKFLSLYKKPPVWIFTMLSLIPSLRPLAKYLPSSMFLIAISVYAFFLLAINGAIVFTLQSKRIPRLFHSPIPFVGILSVIFLVNFFSYPVADDLKSKGKGHGSDQDDALIETGKFLLSGRNPYHAHLYSGNHISPGPGIIFIALPFAHHRLYFSFTPCALLITGLLIAGIYKSFFYSSAFLIFMISSCAFWETMIVGSDMIAMGLLFAMVTVALFYWKERKKPNPVEKGASKNCVRFLSSPAIIIFATLVATSRIIFIGLLPVWGMFLFKKSKRDALIFTGWTILFVLLLHGLFYSMDPAAYTPFHVIRKGKGLMGMILSATGALVTVSVGIVIFFKTRPTLPSWIFSLALACAAPLVFVSLGDFFWEGSLLTKWEGVNYLLIFIPLFYLYFVIKSAESKIGGIRQ
jgi:hypothetical protein